VQAQVKSFVRGFVAVAALLGSQGVFAVDSSFCAEPVSCSAGPYGLQLPDSYDALRKLGTLKDDRILPALLRTGPGAEQRELTFNGLRLTILRKKLDPANYEVVSADVTGRGWKIAGPLKVGGLLPAKIADVDTRQFRGRGVVEFIGESKDVLRVRRSGRRISSISYLCNLR
jgi:hypothetical protein